MAGSLAALMLGTATFAQAADLPEEYAPTQATAPDMYQTSGILGIYGAFATADGDGYDANSWLLGGDALVNIWLTQSLAAQFDINGEVGRADVDDGSSDSEGRHNVTAGGHLAWRNPEMFALGIFGGVAEGTILNDEGEESRYFLGVEGQYYLNNITLYGQAGFSDIISGDDDHAEMTDAWFARAIGRWFVTPNDKVEGEFGYYHSEDIVTGGQGPVTNLNWGALYEHRFAGTMFSAYAEYDGLSRDDDSHSDSGLTEHIFMIGGRIHLQQPDLLTADRYGATFDLPDVIRTENWADLAH